MLEKAATLMSRFTAMTTQNLTGSVGWGHTSLEVKDLATKIGSAFGEKGRQIGQKIDEATEDVRIHIGL